MSFTTGWAKSQRGLKTFAALQSAAGSRGHIMTMEEVDGLPRAVYEWRGFSASGSMRAYLYADGAFAAEIAPQQGGLITLNSFGAFVCPTCTPPVDACGQRPSWIPHDLHWDVFDCSRTMTGPQKR